MTATANPRRSAGEPGPDLTGYRVVHRAMTVDTERLAVAAAQLVARPDPARMAALRHHLHCVGAEIESHHQVEHEFVWPLLVTWSGPRAAVPLPGDADQFGLLLHRAATLAARAEATRELVAALTELAAVLARRVEAVERDVFPLLERHATATDYRRLQQRFRANLRLSLAPSLVPWVFGHTTGPERAALLADGGWLTRTLLRTFEPGFRTHETLLFG